MQALKFAGFFHSLITSQFFTKILLLHSDFAGQTVIVTGSNTGLGKEAARQLVHLKASKVILAAAAKEIVEGCKVSADIVEVWELDAGDDDSISAFAKRVQGLDRLDAAILNAGLTTKVWSTMGTHESTVAVNVLGALRLARGLLPKMKESARHTGEQGRLTVVGSEMMYIAELSELETDGKIVEKLDEKDESSTWMYQRYQITKVLVFGAMKELAKKNPLAETSDVILTVMTPGACKSNLFRDPVDPWMKAVTDWTLGLLQRLTEVGARTLVHAVTAELPLEAHGKSLMNARIGPDRINVSSQQAQVLAKRWNGEVFAVLDERNDPPR
ncbi:hypothetical protein DOTSEDRAFT_35766 [Dothistroma septosporum NZE10]|uniref:Uncharacterized protein n=1 Tax=Dothistroma septosporum (strain NZE10 / CBS 128990) TaxID=675120 RepID=M2WNC4_DOTSN|nr:hypothetical protein DOTSEDRAFT_35766 [Dothistroma septosporum NZE10]